MPTISQLPTGTTVATSDTVPLSQGGVAHSVSLGTLLSSTQPAIIIDQGSILGRVSLGPGGPEQISIGSGLALSAATLQATPLNYSALPTTGSLGTAASLVVTNGSAGPQLLEVARLRELFTAGSNVSISATGVISASGTASASGYSIGSMPRATVASTQDLVGINQAGIDHAITFGSLINGQTIDGAQPAATASDSDTFWVAQGSNTMVAQTFSAMWPWIASKLVTFKNPVTEIASDTTLDGVVHNARLLVCSQPVTLTSFATNMGNGFRCDVVNLSSGVVSFAGSTVASNGVTTLSYGQSATVRCITYSGGTVVYAFMAGGGSGSSASGGSAPGVIGGLVASGSTSSSVQLAWQAPSSGSAATGYTVQYRVTGGSSWTGSIGVGSGRSQTVTGLTANTSYDFYVVAINASGSGPASAVVVANTAAQAGAAASILWNVAPSGSYARGSGAIGINVHMTPALAAAQFGFSSSATVAPSSWTAGSFVNTDLWGAYVPTPATAGTWYAWAAGTDGSAMTVYATAFTVS